MLIIRGGVGPQLYQNTSLYNVLNNVALLQMRLISSPWAVSNKFNLNNNHVNWETFSLKAEILFSELVTRIVSLHGKSRPFKRTVGKDVCLTLRSLINLTDFLSLKLLHLQTQINQDRDSLHNEVIKLWKQEDSIILHQNRLASRLETLVKHEQVLWSGIQDASQLIESLEKKIEAEKRIRKHAWTDLNPIYALSDGIKTGEPKRAIPFYSLLRGIVSVVTEKKELAETQLIITAIKADELKREITSVREQQESKIDERRKLILQITTLVSQIKTHQMGMNVLGKCFVDLSKTTLLLKEIASDYEIMQRRIDFDVQKVDKGLLDDEEIIRILNKLLPPSSITLKEVQKAPTEKTPNFILRMFKYITRS